MDTLQPLVCGYLSALDYEIVAQRPGCVIADKLLIGQDRDTRIVWTVPDDSDPGDYEPQLWPDIRKTCAQYPDGRGTVISYKRGGFGRDFIKDLGDRRVKVLAPVQFFDTPFKVEESTEATRSAIAELRSPKQLKRRVPQPFAHGAHGDGEDLGADLFETLYTRLSRRSESANIYIVVGQAGIGKSVLFRSLFTRLYDDFLAAKKGLRLHPRPIPLVPEHIRNLPTLRTELLLDSFLRTDIAAPVKSEAFEWLLVNGFATWLLDGLDELFAADPDFFYTVLNHVIRKDSKAQILLTCRDSLLSAPDAFRDIEEFLSEGDTLQIYHLCPWKEQSKRLYAWIRDQDRLPNNGENNTPPIQEFLTHIKQSENLKLLSQIPFYCKVLYDLFESAELKEFSNDFDLLNYVVERMINREIDKELLRRDMFQPNGLQEWLEQIAVIYLENSCTSVARSEIEEYANLVLVDAIDADTRDRIVTNMLQFALFSEGSEQGLVAFTHELIAQFLAARWYRTRLVSDPQEIGTRLAKRPDLERATLVRFMAHELGEKEEQSLRNALTSGSVLENSFGPLLSLLMIARPERDLLKQLGAILEGRDLKGISFGQRNMSGLSFRNSDLTDAGFQQCDLTDARFEGALLHRTRLKQSQVNNAEFGDAGRIQSVIVDRKHLESPEEIKEWLTQGAARVKPIQDPCPTALQLRHLFGKFVDRLGNPRRDQLNERGLMAGKRFAGAATNEDCVQTILSESYLIGPDHRHRYRRSEGDRYAEIVAFVKDGKVSDTLGGMVAKLCRRKACLHRVQ